MKTTFGVTLACTLIPAGAVISVTTTRGKVDTRSYQSLPASLSRLSGGKKAGRKVSRWRTTSIPQRIGVGLWPLVRRLTWNFQALGVSSAWDLCGTHPEMFSKLPPPPPPPCCVNKVKCSTGSLVHSSCNDIKLFALNSGGERGVVKIMRSVKLRVETTV